MAERVWISTMSDEDAFVLTGADTWMCLRCGHEGKDLLESHSCDPQPIDFDDPATYETYH